MRIFGGKKIPYIGWTNMYLMDIGNTREFKSKYNCC